MNPELAEDILGLIADNWAADLDEDRTMTWPLGSTPDAAVTAAASDGPHTASDGPHTEG
jgi:hypothetical protein